MNPQTTKRTGPDLPMPASATINTTDIFIVCSFEGGDEEERERDYEFRVEGHRFCSPSKWEAESDTAACIPGGKISSFEDARRGQE